jgi:hypothetical protein
MGKIALLISLLVALLSASARADDWVRPEPTSFHSRGFGYVAEIFPAHSRQNSGDKPLCYFYELGYPDSDWRIDARLKWKAPLVNERMPYQAVISQAGDLITLNEHGSVGYRNAIVVYDQLGRATKAYGLDDLLPADEISMNGNTNKIPISTSSRWWNRNAKYYFYQEPSRFYVVLPWGTALELLVTDGTFHYGAVGNFPELAGARSNPHPNEEVEVWQTSLRFSSITDVLKPPVGAR